MKHEPGLEGKTVRLTKPVVWRNSGDKAARIMPEGKYLRLESYRPEGYNAVTTNGKHFFLFAEYLETAVEIAELTPEAMQEIAEELLNVWNFCGNETEFWREKRWQYKISESQQLTIRTTAEKRWEEYKEIQEKMKQHYTLRFAPGTVPEITGTKEELIAELQHLIDEISDIDEEDYPVFQTVTLYDTNGTDYLTATIELN